MGRATVEVVQSTFWMTNTGIIVTADGSLVLIDPGVFPHELAAIAERGGNGRLLAAISTHEDWDHVLWSRDFPPGIPRLAYPETVRLLEGDREGFLRGLARWEDELGDSWDHELAGRLQPVGANPLMLGGTGIVFIPTPGHTPGHTSLWLAEEGILFAGDMLSDVDIPMLADSPDAVHAYRQSLDVLAPLVEKATMVIPGHGTPCGRDEAWRRLDADRRYIDVLLGWLPNTGQHLASLDVLLPADSRAARPENIDAHRQNAEAVAR